MNDLGVLFGRLVELTEGRSFATGVVEPVEDVPDPADRKFAAHSKPGEKSVKRKIPDRCR